MQNHSSNYLIEFWHTSAVSTSHEECHEQSGMWNPHCGFQWHFVKVVSKSETQNRLENVDWTKTLASPMYETDVKPNWRVISTSLSACERQGHPNSFPNVFLRETDHDAHSLKVIWPVIQSKIERMSFHFL
jgi:hypothetical protein